VKHCPSCNFSFPDFHKVCDFDGTELVPDLEPVAKPKSPPLARFQSTLQSPRFWGSVLAFVAIFTTFLFALYDAQRRSTLAVNAQPSPGAPASKGSVISSAPTPELWPDLSKKPASSTRAGSTNVSRLAASPAGQRRPAKMARTAARQQDTSVASRPDRDYSQARPVPGTSASRSVLKTESAKSKPQQSGSARPRNLSPQERPSEIARGSDSRKTSPQKDRKLTAMLKATWRVLKKPFRF
jgi:hypothetical protein